MYEGTCAHHQRDPDRMETELTFSDMSVHVCMYVCVCVCVCVSY
jgi:hypothetical protein